MHKHRDDVAGVPFLVLDPYDREEATFQTIFSCLDQFYLEIPLRNAKQFIIRAIVSFDTPGSAYAKETSYSSYGFASGTSFVFTRIFIDKIRLFSFVVSDSSVY
jgi:hypothetical protein